jgi:predicted DsbA family dithiol-disulfide isomerase
MTNSDAEITPPPPGTVRLWSDLLCPFAHVLLHTWRQAQLTDPALRDAQIEHRVFPLELFNGPHSRRGTDTEAVGLGQVAPDAGFRVWTGRDDVYPHTVLMAAEAVLAASAQGRRAGDALDAALRRAFWTQSRSIAHRAVILEVAEEVAADPESGLDVGALADALDSGRFRAALHADHAMAQSPAIPGSPTVQLPDGTTVFNPGVAVRWEGPWAEGFPIVERFDPAEQVALLVRAAALVR